MFGRINFQHSEISFCIFADKLGLELRSINEIHFDFIGIGNDVVVRDDIAFFGVNHKTGTKRLHFARIVALVAILVIEEVVEELLKR